MELLSILLQATVMTEILITEMVETLHVQLNHYGLALLEILPQQLYAQKSEEMEKSWSQLLGIVMMLEQLLEMDEMEAVLLKQVMIALSEILLQQVSALYHEEME